MGLTPPGVQRSRFVGSNGKRMVPMAVVRVAVRAAARVEVQRDGSPSEGVGAWERCPQHCVGLDAQISVI